MKKHAKRFLRAHPEASGREVYAHVQTKGVPGMKESSFSKLIVPHLRKELGIAPPKGGRKKTTATPRKAATTPAPDSSADHPAAAPSEAVEEPEQTLVGPPEPSPNGTRPGPASDVPDRDRAVALAFPGGSLVAERVGPDCWRVHADLHVRDATLDLLLQGALQDIRGDLKPGAGVA